MTSEQREIEESKIKSIFSELQNKLTELKNDVEKEADDSKKQAKNEEIEQLEQELSDINIDTLPSLEEAQLQLLKVKLEAIQNTHKECKGEVENLQNEKGSTPSTYELLRNSEIMIGFEGDPNHPGLLKIIESNPNEFKNLPGDTAEKKLEYIFTTIRSSIVSFMENKLGHSEKYKQIINDTIAPAIEWSLMEMLKQDHDTNIKMLEGISQISFGSFSKLIEKVNDFSVTTSDSYNKINQWMNAIDYLAVHNGVLNHPEKSQVLTNPLKFKAYINNDEFKSANFSPYIPIEGNIFEVSEDEFFAFGLSLTEKQSILEDIGRIKVKNDPKTASLIAKLLDKPKKFFEKKEGLQETANGFLNGVNSLNSVTKRFGVDILGDVMKSPEKRSPLYKILDFICKLIGITGGLEGIVKRWRLDRMNLSDKKNDDIRKIFEQYEEDVLEDTSLTITDESSCKEALSDFEVTDLEDEATTKGDYLRDSIAQNMDVSLISPAIVKQAIEEHILSGEKNKYLKEETVTVKRKQQEKITIIPEGFTLDDKKRLAQYHLSNMKSHLQEYDKNSLKDFYTSVDSSDDIALCIIASLYTDKNDVIEGVKAKVFLPENYGSISSDGTIDNLVGDTISELTPEEKNELQNLVKQSKTPNNINYLENATYKKYLNIIERDLKLPKYILECVCSQESRGYLYKDGKIIGSNKGAQGLFQFVPGTANEYMKCNKLKAKYGKIFTSRNEFLKDPLATAWASGIMYSEFLHNYNYNLKTSLACYNRGIGNYRNEFGDRSLTSGDLKRLPKETREYVEIITADILAHNSVSSSDDNMHDIMIT